MKIHALHVYPIKSLRGCSLPSLRATYQGLQHDRRFMLLKASDSRNMHVAHFPELTLFTTHINLPDHDESKSTNSYPTSDPSGDIIVTFHPPVPNDFSPGHTEKSSITVPLVPSTDFLATLEVVEVVMHRSPTKAFDMGRQYNDWFGTRLGYGVRLLYLGPKNQRPTLGELPPQIALKVQRQQQQQQQQHEAEGGNSPENTNSQASWYSSITNILPSIPILGISTTSKQDEPVYPGVDAGLTFSDCAPYLVVSLKSWENASSRLPPGEDMDITKFRPNIIVSGADEAFEEDFWAEIEIFESSQPQSRLDIEPSQSESDTQPQSQSDHPKAKLILTHNCARCGSINIDYKTGKPAAGPAGKMLAKLMGDRRVDAGWKYSPVFGRYGFLDRIVDDTQTMDGGGHIRDGGPPTKGVELRVGDTVRISRRNTHQTKFVWPGLGN